jgi:fructokinase
VQNTVRIGIDFGGTKIEGAALDVDGAWLNRLRVPTPDTYDAAIEAVLGLVARIEAENGTASSIGIGVPGSISPHNGRMRNANAVFLNGHTFREDLSVAFGRDIRLENDANCLALSEARDGAAAGARVTFAVIIGTGCGGGVVVDGKIVTGANGIAGEWGHIPLPWPNADERPGTQCWCGQVGCLETWISGTGFQKDYLRRSGTARSGSDITVAARGGEAAAVAALDAYVDRLGRALAVIANVIDPDCFVLGGGMSNISELYDRLPAVIDRHAFSDGWRARIVPARWGDSSGVRGAAYL